MKKMKRISRLLATLVCTLGFTACDNNENTPFPMQGSPMEIRATIAGGADTRSTVNNSWNGGETVALSVNGDYYDYTVDAEGNMSGNYYWQNRNSITVQGLCPSGIEDNSMSWSVGKDQSTDADYQSGDLLCSESKLVNFGQTPTLTFYHQTAKVVVNIKQEGLPESISATTGDISLTIGEGGILTMDGTFTLPTVAGSDSRWLGTWTPGSTKGSITPHLATTKPEGCFATYEALVIPQDVTTGTKLFTFTATKDGNTYGPFYYTLKGDVKWNSGYVYTYDITIFHYGLEVQVSESINWENGGTGSGSITLEDSYDQETDTYYAYTANGLKDWATAVSSGNTDANCILFDDIDFKGSEWTPIGSSDNGFTGIFDGQGHTIRNLTIANALCTGLFARIAEGGTVQNVTFKDVTLFQNTDNGGFAGIIAGENYGTITHCRIEGCTLDAEEAVNGAAGGIAGDNNGTITYCEVTDGSLQAYGYSGGIVGRSLSGDIRACWADATCTSKFTNNGGVSGCLDNGIITACYWCSDDNSITKGVVAIWGGTDETRKVDGTTYNWQTATQAMNEALGTDAEYHWHTDDSNTPPTLVPNNK